MGKILYRSLALILIFSACSDTQKVQEKESNTIDFGISVARIDNFRGDAILDEWDREHTTVQLNYNGKGEIIDSNDLSAKMDLAWNSEGLCIRLKVKDDTLYESSNPENLLNGDCIEFFVSDKCGGENLLQFIVSPGVTENQPEPRVIKWEQRSSRALTDNIDPTIEFKAIATMDGYIAEALIPFNQLGLSGLADTELSFQINIVDLDTENGKTQSVQWHYLNNAYLNTFAGYTLKLTEDEAQNVSHSIRAFQVDYDSVYITINTNNNINNIVKILNNGKQLRSLENVRDELNIGLSIYEVDTQFSELFIYLNNELIDICKIEILQCKFVDAERYPLEQYVRTLLYKRKLSPPPSNGIMFIGTSHIRFWKTLVDDMPDLPVYNHGFGGSQTQHVLHYMDSLVLSYKPSVIVYVEGANDVSVGREAEEIAANTESFINRVHEALPKTQILIIKHPDKLIRGREALNKLAVLHQSLADKYDFVQTIDAKHALTDTNGNYYEGIMQPDNTHMNPKGYSYFRVPIYEKVKEVYSQSLD